MRNVIVWIAQNTLIVLALLTAAAVAAIVQQTREVKASDYESMSRMYPRGPAEVRQHIRDALAGGRVTMWDYTLILREAMESEAMMSWSRHSGSLEFERENLRRVVAQDKPHG